MNALTARQEAHFEALYAASDDPWHVRDAWYEQRKRAVLLACLPNARYAHAFEPGCGNGELTAALAARCERVDACDGSASAVAAARLRVGARPGVRIDQRRLPQDWPDGAAMFDLVVVSELAYYFTEAAWSEMLARILASLAPGGMLVLCHWRHPFADRVIATDKAHGLVHAAPALRARLHHIDHDFLLDGWLRA